MKENDIHADFFDAIAKLSRPKITAMKDIIEQDAFMKRRTPVKKGTSQELTIKREPS